MAALLLGCAALVSERVSTRRKNRKENKLEYEQRFDEFQAQNQRTDAWRNQFHRNRQGSEGILSPQELYDSRPPPHRNTNRQPADSPPSYEDAIGQERKRDREVELRVRSDEARGRRDRETAVRRRGVEREGRDRMRVPLIEQTDAPKSTELGTSERIAVRDLALAHG